MFSRKKKKEMESRISMIDNWIRTLELDLGKLKEDLNNMRENVEMRIDVLFGNMREYKIDHNEYHNKMQKELEKSIKAIEARLCELADVIDTLRKPPEEQKRCGICGRILTRNMYIGTSYYDEKLVIHSESRYLCNPIPVCEHCAKLNMDRLSYLYMKALSKEKEG